VVEEEKPAHKALRMTRSGARGLSASTKKLGRDEMRNKMREDAIRRASTASASSRKVSQQQPLTNSARKASIGAAIPAPAAIAANTPGGGGQHKAAATHPVEFKFGSSRRRSDVAGEDAAPIIIAGVNDPFSLGRSAHIAGVGGSHDHAAPAYDPTTLTRPRAFNLATANRAALKRSAAVAAGEAEGAEQPAPVVFKSTKEMITAFQNKTPARFHSRSRLDNKPELPEEFNATLTVPVRNVPMVSSSLLLLVVVVVGVWGGRLNLTA
jgi:hypothetical protein